jgi:hypothetical protein
MSEPKLPPATVALQLEVLQREFLGTGNPVCALMAFCVARAMSHPVPNWVLDWLYEGMRKYVLAEGQDDKGNTLTLDACLGLKAGKGGTPPYKQALLDSRDEFLKIDMFRLVYLGYTIDAAAGMVEAKLAASDWNRTRWEMADVKASTLADRYKKEWSKGFAKHRLLIDAWLRNDLERSDAFIETFPADVRGRFRPARSPGFNGGPK